MLNELQKASGRVQLKFAMELGGIVQMPKFIAAFAVQARREKNQLRRQRSSTCGNSARRQVQCGFVVLCVAGCYEGSL